MKKIITLNRQSFQEFIYTDFRQACVQRSLYLSEGAYHYIATIACRYLKSDNLFQQNGAQRSIPTLAFLYRDALQAKTLAEQRQLIQSLADTSFFLASFFPTIWRRRGLDKRYFSAMGESAYDALASLRTDLPCLEIAQQFSAITLCLGEVIFPHYTQH